MIQSQFPLIYRIFPEIPSIAVLLHRSRFEILHGPAIDFGTLSVILVIHHTEQVETIFAPIQIDLLEQIAIMLVARRGAVAQREPSPVGAMVVIRITAFAVAAYLAPGLVTTSTAFILDASS